MATVKKGITSVKAEKSKAEEENWKVVTECRDKDQLGVVR